MSGIRSVLIVLLVSVLIACTGGATAQRTAELVARDYQVMSDQELQTHYTQLSDQLARESRAERMSQSGRGAPRTQDSEAVSALREHWNQVRQEMRQRDLLP